MKAEKKLSDKNVYKEVNFNKKLIQDLAESCSKIFRSLISDKDLKYFSCDHKKPCNLGKLHYLPKIQKRLFNVPDRSVISNCGTEFFDSHLKTLLQGSWSDRRFRRLYK